MFNKKIRETALTRDMANDFFKINGDTFNNDRSFLATLRALLHKRSHDAAIRLSILNASCYGYNDYTFTADGETDRVLSGLLRFPADMNTLAIRCLDGAPEDNAAVFALCDNPDFGFVKNFPDFHDAKDLSVFVQKRGKLNARFYINETAKVTLIVCDGMSIATYHLIQSLTPRLFPWFFSEIPLDEVETSLLDSLTYRTSAEYERILAVLADRIDFREHAIRKIIGDFDKLGRREEIQQTKGRWCFSHNKSLLKKNIDIWNEDPEMFQRDIVVAAFHSRFFRWHSSGDIPDMRYLEMMVDTAKKLPETKFLCFTKKFELVNEYLKIHNSFPANLRMVFSAWGSFIPENPYNLPMAYVRFKNEHDCYIPQDAFQCKNYCGDCVMSGCSCWDLKNGESVCFNEH